MSAAQRAVLTTRRSFLHHGATLAGAVALPTGRAGAAEAVAGAPSAPVRLAQAGTGTAAASSAITTKSSAPRRQRHQLCICSESGAVGIPQRPRSLRLRAGTCAGSGRAAWQSPERPPAAAARSRLSAAPDARHSQGIRHRSAQRRAGRPVLHHGPGGIGLSPGALR